MRQFMNINSESAKESRQRLIAAIDRINAYLGGNKYLVGQAGI